MYRSKIGVVLVVMMVTVGLDGYRGGGGGAEGSPLPSFTGSKPQTSAYNKRTRISIVTLQYNLGYNTGNNCIHQCRNPDTQDS